MGKPKKGDRKIRMTKIVVDADKKGRRSERFKKEKSSKKNTLNEGKVDTVLREEVEI